MRGPPSRTDNLHAGTVASFGDEWHRFDQSELPEAEREDLFRGYFAIFPWDALPAQAEGFDMGCGTGRWAQLVAPRIGRLNCIDPSSALEVARRNLEGIANVVLLPGSVEAPGLAPASQDFGYSLGVLHHVPDTAAAIRACVRLLKPGAPFLVYLYYALDNRPFPYRWAWRASEWVRRVVQAMPAGSKAITCDLLAAFVYWPLARTARLLEVLGLPVSSIPLSFYRDKSFYTMRTDSRDRFGTPLEQRFTRAQIESMMAAAGLRDIRFSDNEPYWCAVGVKQ